MTCEALIVSLFTLPNTMTVFPLVTALAADVSVPSSYVVDELVLTVAFTPVGVDSVKLEPDTLLTVPIDPPAAFVDLAFDPPPVPA